VGGGGTDRRVCGRASLPPVPARLSPTTHGGDSWGLSGAGTRMDGWATRYTAELADRRRSTAHVDAAAVLRTVPRCN